MNAACVSLLQPEPSGQRACFPRATLPEASHVVSLLSVLFDVLTAPNSAPRHLCGCISLFLIVVAAMAGVVEKANSATILLGGEIIPAEDVTDQPAYALALANGSINFAIGHVDGTADATMTWFEVTSPVNTLERYVELGSDVPNTVIAPDQLNDGIESSYLFVIAELPELSTLRYALDADGPGNPNINLFRFLAGARVRAGFGLLSGNPQNGDEATAMTDGAVVEAIYPQSVELDDAWIFRSVRPIEAPEPAMLGLVGTAAAASMLALMRRVRRPLP